MILQEKTLFANLNATGGHFKTKEKPLQLKRKITINMPLFKILSSERRKKKK